MGGGNNTANIPLLETPEHSRNKTANQFALDSFFVEINILISKEEKNNQ
jgi:hypothetical protein